MSGDEKAYLFYMLILLFFIGGGFLYGNREKLSTTLMQAAIWVLIFMGVLIGYGFKDTLQQQFAPSRAVQNGDAFEIVRGADRHFHLTLKVNGQNIRFIVDTGASDIVLTREDAARVGIDVDNLAYLGRASTANGVVATASTVLDQIQLGDVVDRNVRASVNGGEMFGSLLGMAYLNRFSEISIRGDRLILKR
ncbi:TIGR02281 family clan AA aspartic protease [Amylibacter sp. IMCC11727]|uniref:retropepsin-like aspartic protease family protein n=1 Tax=Amylibacter sp. IMCC11727 TaxID=3039851 RepID=UPI00244E0B10|nr:TIGR02281 family clan AA aspartic protease [Amylibacter sp. IMCC11727]WGI20758.1 TIGR02281 family clan AA aspartic protease [Amylibacter sp. IMCC11727]